MYAHTKCFPIQGTCVVGHNKNERIILIVEMTIYRYIFEIYKMGDADNQSRLLIEDDIR